MSREANNRQFYGRDSATYDEERWQRPGGAWTNRTQQAIVQDLCADWVGGRVLEIGPGTGRFSIPLARQGNRLSVADVSWEMLGVARRNLEAAGVGDRIDGYVNGSIYRLPFADDSFDHALALNVFNHLSDFQAALQEMARVVRPGSTLLFNYANLHSYFWLAARRINRRRRAVGRDVLSTWLVPSAVEAMMASAGLHLVHRVGNVHVPRAMERYRLQGVLALLDGVSRRGPLHRLAPTHYCLCRKEPLMELLEVSRSGRDSRPVAV